MEKSDLNLMLYGEEFIDKTNRFDDLIKQIENKHIEWFRVRPNEYNHAEHDRLKMHTIETFDSNRHIFGFRKDSDVPEHIKQECYQAFNEVWGR